MFGLLFSLKQLMNKANPVACVTRQTRSPRVLQLETTILTLYLPRPPSIYVLYQGGNNAASFNGARTRVLSLRDGLVRAHAPRDSDGV